MNCDAINVAMWKITNKLCSQKPQTNKIGNNWFLALWSISHNARFLINYLFCILRVHTRTLRSWFVSTIKREKINCVDRNKMRIIWPGSVVSVVVTVLVSVFANTVDFVHAIQHNYWVQTPVVSTVFNDRL